MKRFHPAARKPIADKTHRSNATRTILLNTAQVIATAPAA
jgi:hypothetical protein